MILLRVPVLDVAGWSILVLFVCSVYCGNSTGVNTDRAKGPPHLLDEFLITDIELEEGATMEVECNMGGFPLPIMQWVRNGRQMFSSHDPRYNITKTNLRISSVQQDDSGKYECQGYNQHGYKDVLFYLTVLPKNKTMRTVHSNATASHGESVVMKCNLVVYDDSHKYNISWFKRESLNQNFTEKDVVKENVIIGKTSATLYIDNVTEDNAGVYTCIATTTVAVEKCHTWLTVSSDTEDNLDKQSNSFSDPQHTDNRSSLLIIIISTIGVVALVTVGLVLLFFHRKKLGSTNHSVNYNVINTDIENSSIMQNQNEIS